LGYIVFQGKNPKGREPEIITFSREKVQIPDSSAINILFSCFQRTRVFLFKLQREFKNLI